MGKRQFVLKMTWSWDYSNDEMATFTIEEDEEGEHNPDNPLFIDKPLTAETFRIYVETYEEVIKGIVTSLCEAVNGNPMGVTRAVELYEVSDGGYPIKRINVCGTSFLMLRVTNEPLCKFDEDGCIVFLDKKKRSK